MAGTITSYNTLVSAIVETMEDDSAEFLTWLPAGVGMAEQRLGRETDAQGLVLIATVTAQSGVPTLTKPTGYKNGQDLWFIESSSGERTLVKKKPYSYVLDYWPVPGSVGVPKYYADVDTSTFIVAPTPNTSIAMTLRYEGLPTPIGVSNQTNYFTDFMPDILFYATMVEVCKFSRNYTLLKEYDGRYTEARDTVVNESRRARQDNSGNPHNATLNTLRKDDV